jgi:hypothetical protein
VDGAPAFRRLAVLVGTGGADALTQPITRHPDLVLWWFREVLAHPNSTEIDPFELADAIAVAWRAERGSDALARVTVRCRRAPDMLENVKALVAGHRLVDRGLVSAGARVVDRLEGRLGADTPKWVRGEWALLAARCGRPIANDELEGLLSLHKNWALAWSSERPVPVLDDLGQILVLPSLRAAEVVSASPALQIELASAAADAGFSAESLRLAVRARSADPQRAQALIVSALLRLDRAEEALAATRHLEDLHVRTEARARALEALGRYEQARATVRRVFSEQPEPVSEHTASLALMAIRYDLLDGAWPQASSRAHLIAASPTIGTAEKSVAELYGLIAESRHGSPDQDALASLHRRLKDGNHWRILVQYHDLFHLASRSETFATPTVRTP